MTVWIPEYLSKAKVETSDDQTLYIDLPANEQISFLQVEVSAQGSATPRTTTTLIDDIEKYEVIADGSQITVKLNGTTIVDADISNLDVPKKVIDAHPGLKNEKGYIAFCGHGNRLAFRSLRIKTLD